MSEWRFLLDENVDPKTATYLQKEDVYAEHVRETLGQGAEDDADVIPYAENHELVVVTSDVTDFSERSRIGVVLLYDDTMPAYEVASALLTMIDAYPSREAFAGCEILDSWA